MLAGTHMIVAVNSGAGGGTEVLARVDLLAGWIKEQVATNGGAGEPGADPGGDPGQDPGADPGGDPGQDPGADPGEGGDCNGVDFVGQCQGAVLSWCEGALQTVDCAEMGMACGFDDENGFYDCLGDDQ
jgi:hypothetical protein